MRVETLDLHGLSVEEALSKTEKQLDWITSHGVPVLAIIHGKGHHNANRVAVIKQTLRKQLKENKSLSSQGYIVIYGESEAAIALTYDEGVTLVVQKEYVNEYIGGRTWQKRNKPRYKA